MSILESVETRYKPGEVKPSPGPGFPTPEIGDDALYGITKCTHVGCPETLTWVSVIPEVMIKYQETQSKLVRENFINAERRAFRECVARELDQHIVDKHMQKPAKGKN